MVFRGLDQQPYLFDFIECQQAATNPNDAFLFCRINGTFKLTLLGNAEVN